MQKSNPVHPLNPVFAGDAPYVTFCMDMADGNLQNAIGAAGLWRNRNDAEWACVNWFIDFVKANPTMDWSAWEAFHNEVVYVQDVIPFVDRTYPDRVRLDYSQAIYGQGK